MKKLKVILNDDESKIFNSIFSDVNYVVKLDKNYQKNGFIEIYNSDQKNNINLVDFRELIVKLSADIIREGLVSDKKFGVRIQFSFTESLKKDFEKELKRNNKDVKKALFSSMEKLIENENLIKIEDVKSFESLKFKLIKVIELIINLINKIFEKNQKFNEMHKKKSFDELRNLREDIKKNGFFLEKVAFNKLIHTRNNELNSPRKEKK